MTTQTSPTNKKTPLKSLDPAASSNCCDSGCTGSTRAADILSSERWPLNNAQPNVRRFSAIIDHHFHFDHNFHIGEKIHINRLAETKLTIVVGKSLAGSTCDREQSYK